MTFGLTAVEGQDYHMLAVPASGALVINFCAPERTSRNFEEQQRADGKSIGGQRQGYLRDQHQRILDPANGH